MCLSIVACTAEQEEVCKCMRLLKKLFGIGQQCKCANAGVKRKANIKKGRQQRKGNVRGRVSSGGDRK